MSALKAASESVQAHERLVYELKNSGGSSDVISEAEAILNQLKDFKSKIEGSHFTFQPIVLDKQLVTTLKHSVVAFTPKTITEQAKHRIVDQLLGLLEGQVRKVLYACLLTCPWFAAVQDEVSGKAKNNILFVVYVARDEQFFSLATQHEKELCEVCEELPLCAVEVRHYCQQLHRGNVRFIEAYYCSPESIIFTTPEWLQLLTVIQPQQLLDRTFLDRCVGQAMGGIVHKKKISGRLVVRDDANLVKFCDSLRLLHYAKLAVNGQPIVVWEELSPTCDGPRKPFLQTLAGAFERRLPREAVLEQLLPLRYEVVGKMETISRHTSVHNSLLKNWLSGIRLNSRQLLPLAGCGDAGDKLKALLKEISADINPDNVIVLAQAGSKMYGLSTPTSDTDYIIVYRNQTEDIISTTTNLKETLDSRGKQQTIEFAAYEVRLYCEMLLKGAVNMFELLYATDVFYHSEEWKDLVAQKHLFMSEHVVLQYFGFVMTHMKIIESGKHSNTPREGKLFYHVFHKLLSLELFTQNKPPVVYCSGEQKDFIMKIRKGPLEGDLSKDTLLALAKQRLASVRKHLLERPERLREQGDYGFLQSWLLKVRGIELDEPLTMITSPLKL